MYGFLGHMHIFINASSYLLEQHSQFGLGGVWYNTIVTYTYIQEVKQNNIYMYD